MVNPLAITLLCMGGAAALIFLLWLNHALRTGAKREKKETTAGASWVNYGLSYVLGGAGPVNDYEGDAPAVMSRGAPDAARFSSSALETDTRQTTDRPMMPVPTPEQMLDIFRVLRAAGIKREALSEPWRAAGLPLNNNIWSKAEPPPPEPVNVTPIAGRPTNAKFHQDDPELEYKPLA